MEGPNKKSNNNSNNNSNFSPNNKQNLYDLEININSILGFLKGWDITFGKDGKDKYEKAKKNREKIFSVIGNKNKGKSFLLSKIVGRDLPNGFSVTTKGLSISFPTGMDNIALFDSVGFESPLLEIDGDEYRLKSGSDEKDKKNDNLFYNKMNELDKQIKKLKKEKSKLEDIREKENEYFRERNEFRKNISNKDGQLIDLTNERRVTDFFLQRFIIESAHVILLVVGKLSIEDQFFLNKLTTLIKEEKGRFLQKVIVIHNLMTMEKKEVVENYIEETLKKSLTFTIEEKKDLKIEGGRKNNSYNRSLYYEKNDDSDKNGKKGIIHIIMAKYGTEAGDYYNDSAIDYIKKAGDTVFNTEEFDVIKNLKEYFCNVGDTILKLESPDEKIKPENIELIKDNNRTKLILNYKKKIELETFYGDFISFTFGEPKFTPEWYIVSTDPEYVILYLDCPGETTIESVFIKYLNDITTIYIKGNRKKIEFKTMGRNFGSGSFSLRIPLKGPNGNVTKKFIQEYVENGFYKIKIKRERKV
jgi:hypothetical protein